MSFNKPGFPSVAGIKDPKAKNVIRKLREHAQIAAGARGEEQERFVTAEDVDEKLAGINKFVTGQGDNFRLSDKAVEAVDTPNIKKGAIATTVQTYLPARIALSTIFQTLATASIEHSSGNGIEVRMSCFLGLSVSGVTGSRARIEVRLSNASTGGGILWGEHIACESIVQAILISSVATSSFSASWWHLPPVGNNTYELEARVAGLATTFAGVAYGRCLILREDKI